MKRLIVAPLVVLMLTLMLLVAPASAHVHGVTPLIGLDCVVDFDGTGGNGTTGTPADSAEGGPITGLIPRDTGNAPLNPGDGGFGVTDGNCE